MIGKLHKKDIIRCAVALVCVGIVVCLSLYKEKKSLQYDIVILGDSVVGTAREDTNVATVLEARLGKTVFNGAFGGSSMTMPKTLLWESVSSVEWCMVKLAEAISYDDWTSQKAVMKLAEVNNDANLQVLSYFPERMDRLTQIDFSKVEALIIQHGTNDYNSGRPVDNPEDLYDVTTYGGALRYSLRLLQEKYPKLRIVLVSPIYCSLGQNFDKKCYNTAYGEGGVLDEYVELEKQIAGEFKVEWVDAYHESGIWEDNADIYLEDALHPNVEGHILLGNLIADYLEDGKDEFESGN